MRQRRWLELLKDYDANIQYHLGKANVVADALSRKNFGIMACLKIQPEIIKDLELIEVELVVRSLEEEDEEEEEIVAEDEAEIIYPYDEADPNNRPPLASNDESEFAPSVISVFDTENRPVPPAIHFSSTYELGESSSARSRILRTSMRFIHWVQKLVLSYEGSNRKLNEKMRERAEVDKRIVKKIDRSDLRIRMVGRDAMSLDGAIRECQANESRQALELVEWEAGVREQYLPMFRLRGGFVETSTRSFLGPFLDDPYVQTRNDAMADDDVEDDDVEDEDDMDDDVADPSNPQSSEPRGSLRDS
ncbi:hypothetical protein Tco_1351785 [Tanacetum coccineum]